VGAAGALEERVVEGIVDELGELLGEGLDVAVFDDCRCVSDIGGQDEGVAGGGVDAVGSPGAADGGVTVGVEGGVVGDGEDEFAILLGELLEEGALDELEVRDGEGGVGLLRGEDVAEAYGDGEGDRLDLGLGELGVPVGGAREGGAEEGVGVLGFACGGEGDGGEDGGVKDAGDVLLRVHDEGGAFDFLRLEDEVHGDEDGGDGGDGVLRGGLADEGVRALGEGGDGALRVGCELEGERDEG
jgi:hypothetical protein